MYLFYLFLYSFCLAMTLPLLLPFWHLLYFAPFLVLSFYRCSLVSCLWWSLSCGFIIDLFSADTRLGTYAMNYCITTYCLYRYKFHFFEDRLSTLPVMACIFTCLSTLIQTAIFIITSKSISLSWEWVMHDLFLIPMEVALYTILAFSLPLLIVKDLKRRYLLFRFARRKP